jgi:hypothetical protein
MHLWSSAMIDCGNLTISSYEVAASAASVLAFTTRFIYDIKGDRESGSSFLHEWSWDRVVDRFDIIVIAAEGELELF